MLHKDASSAQSIPCYGSTGQSGSLRPVDGTFQPLLLLESIWQGLGEWRGAGKEKLAEITPHARAFIAEAEGNDALFGNNKLFK